MTTTFDANSFFWQSGWEKLNADQKRTFWDQLNNLPVGVPFYTRSGLVERTPE